MAIQNAKEVSGPLVNKQWLEFHHSRKHKQISIDLNGDGRLLNYLTHPTLQPSKWVRSIRLHLSYSASHPPILNVDGDPLHLWMTCCPYVQRIKLPQEMDSDRRENDWMYFSRFLESINVWKLESLSVGDSGYIQHNNTKRNYFGCLYHLRGSIKHFKLTRNTIPGERYDYLQDFVKLTSITLCDDMVNSLAEGCEILYHLPYLERATIYFKSDNTLSSNNTTTQTPESNSPLRISHQTSSTAAAASAERATTCPTIHSMHLYNYNIFSSIQRDNMLHLKRFDNLNYLYICLPKTANINDIADDTVLGYVHKAIQSYEIVVMSDFDSTIYECQYLDLYCNGLKNCQDNTGSNGLTSRLHIPFLEYEPSSKANGEYHTHNIITFVKNKDKKDSSAVGAMDGEIHCSIGAKPRPRLDHSCVAKKI